MEDIDILLREREQMGLLRELRPASYRGEGIIRIDGREYIDLSSNDYLGLSHHPALIKASCEAVERFGTSSSGSRLMSGDLLLHHELEERVAKLVGKEKALFYSTGYQANLGIISSLLRKGDCVFVDRLSHASIMDGILLSRARIFRFRHNDPEHLEFLLKRERNSFKRGLILTETIFSMDGDRCPLKELIELKNRYGLFLMVDEAHAIGVFGKRGGGIVEEEGLGEYVDIIMGTFGKALGGFGAYVASSSSIIDYLVNLSRPFIYSTAPPPSVIGVNLASLDIIENEQYHRKELLERVDIFRKDLKAHGINPKGSSQIVPIIIGGVKKVTEFSNILRDSGYWVIPIRQPTVPKGSERVRLSICLFHSKEMLKGLSSKIIESLRTIGYNGLG